MAGAFTAVLALMIVAVGLGLGTTLSLGQVKESLAKPKAFLIGIACQFVFMPLVSFALCKAFDLADELAVGLILVGSSPGGSTSNLFTYWSRGNVALSVTMSAASTLAAFGTMPLCAYLYADLAYGSETRIAFVELVLALLLCLVPFALGMWVRHVNTESMCGGKYYWRWMEIVGSAAGAIFLVAAISYGLATQYDIFEEAGVELWFAAVLMEPIGCALGYLCAWAAKLRPRDCRTIALETGVQNSSLTIAIIQFTYGTNDPVGERVLIGPYAYALLYVVHSAWIVLVFRHYLAKFDDDEDEEADTGELEASKVAGAPIDDGTHASRAPEHVHVAEAL